MWIQQIERHFYLQPHLYLNDERGIAWATRYLKDAAYEWFMPYWNTVGNTNHVITWRWAAFVHAFILHFRDPEAESKAESKLKTLKQFRSVTDYVAKFNLLQIRVQWDERALIFHFKNGLKADVIRFGGAVGWPETLEGVKERAMKIDEGLMQARTQERHSNFQTSYRPPNRPNYTPRPQGNAAEETTVQQEANVGSTIHSKKQGPLSQEEKDRRWKLGLCMYCGGPNHKAVDCGVAKAKKKYQGKVGETQMEAGEYVDPFSGKGKDQ